MAIQGQNTYGNITLARQGAITEIGNLVTEGLPMAEGIPLATVIYKTNDTYTSPSKSYVQLTDTGNNYVN